MRSGCRLLVITGAGLLLLTAAGLAQDAEAGRQLYVKYCTQCHGDNGDGRGIAASFQKPRPRDFTSGKFKVRSTPTGALPTDDDLKRIIRDGMPYTAMPGFPEFTDRQLTNLVAHIKTFYPGFSGAAGEVAPIPIPRAPRASQESIERGRLVYEAQGCAQCHGDSGRGGGPSAPTLADDAGYHLRAANLTKPWTFRGGSGREDIYRTFMTGFMGTPMPSYADPGALPEEDRWPLVDYVSSLADDREPNYSLLVTAVRAPGEVDLEEGVSLFESAPVARFPVVGQIMEPSRNFYPSVTDIEVRVVYDGQDIAFLLQWDDQRADTAGRNQPDLEVPPFDPAAEEEAERVRRPGAEPEDDFWGEGAAAGDDFWDLAQPAIPEAPPSEFSDAIAIQFPVRTPRGVTKPYFIFGDAQNPVELWFVDLADQRPQLYLARGSTSIESGNGEPFEVTAHYEDGRWSAVFKRRKSSLRSISFQQDQFVPIAFSVWDGFNRERGNRRGLTSWFYLYVEPAQQPSPVGPMVTNSLAVLAALALVVFVVRRKYSQPTQQEETQ